MWKVSEGYLTYMMASEFSSVRGRKPSGMHEYRDLRVFKCPTTSEVINNCLTISRYNRSGMRMISDIKIGITGLPGAGKTTALLRVIDMLKGEDLSIGGMINEPIVEGRYRVGFTTRNLITGETETFASNDFESKIMVGKMGVNIDALERVGVAAIKDACENCDIIIIDEVGKMEVESELFSKVVKEALDVNKPMILTLHKKSRNPLLQDIRRRDDVRILEVTPTNRNLLPYKIVRLMNGENI